MSPPVSATLRDWAGIEAISLHVRPDHDLCAVTIAVVGEMKLELLLAPEPAVDLALEIVGAITRLQEGE